MSSPPRVYRFLEYVIDYTYYYYYYYLYLRFEIA
jgi:hypothetical protein